MKSPLGLEVDGPLFLGSNDTPSVTKSRRRKKNLTCNQMFHRQAFKSLENIPINQDAENNGLVKPFCTDEYPLNLRGNENEIGLFEQEFINMISLNG